MTGRAGWSAIASLTGLEIDPLGLTPIASCDDHNVDHEQKHASSRAFEKLLDLDAE
jgi:hypothetical protein